MPGNVDLLIQNILQKNVRAVLKKRKKKEKISILFQHYQHPVLLNSILKMTHDFGTCHAYSNMVACF